MKLLYGKPVAEKILNRLEVDISLRTQKPGLAVVLVGEDKASQLYVSLKEKMAKRIGINFFRLDLSENISQDELLGHLEKLNMDSAVSGVIVQLPLPSGFDTQKIISSIDPKKDVDGFSIQSGHAGLIPVFPQAIIRLMESAQQQLVGKKAVVIANSDIFGQTMSRMLEQQSILAEYILSAEIAHNLGKIKEADIVVSAVGSPGLIKGEMLKDDAIVIDGGIEKVGEKVLGDVDFGSAEALNGYITPVPGGVGPVTIACLLENTFLAFKAQQKEK